MTVESPRVVRMTFRPMDRPTAQDVLRWRYDPPYDLYNVEPDETHEFLCVLLDAQNRYYYITDAEGELVAYSCFGPEARVAGGDYTAPRLDIGLGLRPDLTGRGQGLSYAEAVLDFARDTFPASVFRVTVASFNKRALRVWEKAGFKVSERFRRKRDGRDFVVLIRDA